ncbi:MAG TPA: hypothetical protein VFM48_07055 [Aquabacterium sp.]|nr:hypothetical protein [Aquabacterium sp.]
MTHSKQQTRKFIVLAGGLALAGGVAQADPLTLTASHNWMHDSNFARTETPTSDTINTTGLQLDLNKQYGRQTYTGMAKIAAVRYSKYGRLLDNDAKDLSLGFDSELMSNWRVVLDGAYGQRLNQFENNKVTDHVVKNIQTNKNAEAQLIYGVSGIWAVVASGTKAHLDYSVPAYDFLNYRQDGQGLKAVYYSSDLLNYSLGVRHVNTEYTLSSEHIDENDVDLSTNWVVSGLSQMSATLSWTSSKRRIQSDRRFKGLTGYINWNYTPHGVLSYGLSAYRTSNSDQFNQNYLSFDPGTGAFGINSSQLAYNNRVTSANVYVKWAATGKLTLTAATAWNHYNVDYDLIGSAIRDTSNYHSYSLNGYYDVQRWLKLSAGVIKYSQTRDATRNPYSGHAVNVAASFIFQ